MEVCLICCKNYILDEDVDTFLSHSVLQQFITVVERTFGKNVRTYKNVQEVLDHMQTTHVQDGGEDNCNFQDRIYNDTLGCCRECLNIMELSCDFYHQMKCLELKLFWRLYTISTLMKSGGGVPTRVRVLKNVCKKLDAVENYNSINGFTDPETKWNTFSAVSEFRKELLQKCSQPTPIPFVSLPRTVSEEEGEEEAVVDNHHEGFSSLSPNLARENYTEGQAQNSAGSVDGESFTLVNQNQNTDSAPALATQSKPLCNGSAYDASQNTLVASENGVIFLWNTLFPEGEVDTGGQTGDLCSQVSPSPLDTVTPVLENRNLSNANRPDAADIGLTSDNQVTSCYDYTMLDLQVYNEEQNPDYPPQQQFEDNTDTNVIQGPDETMGVVAHTSEPNAEESVQQGFCIAEYGEVDNVAGEIEHEVNQPACPEEDGIVSPILQDKDKGDQAVPTSEWHIMETEAEQHQGAQALQQPYDQNDNTTKVNANPEPPVNFQDVMEPVSPDPLVDQDNLRTEGDIVAEVVDLLDEPPHIITNEAEGSCTISSEEAYSDEDANVTLSSGSDPLESTTMTANEPQKSCGLVADEEFAEDRDDISVTSHTPSETIASECNPVRNLPEKGDPPPSSLNKEVQRKTGGALCDYSDSESECTDETQVTRTKFLQNEVLASTSSKDVPNNSKEHVLAPSSTRAFAEQVTCNPAKRPRLDTKPGGNNVFDSGEKPYILIELSSDEEGEIFEYPDDGPEKPVKRIKLEYSFDEYQKSEKNSPSQENEDSILSSISNEPVPPPPSLPPLQLENVSDTDTVSRTDFCSEVSASSLDLDDNHPESVSERVPRNFSLSLSTVERNTEAVKQFTEVASDNAEDDSDMEEKATENFYDDDLPASHNEFIYSSRGQVGIVDNAVIFSSLNPAPDTNESGLSSDGENDMARNTSSSTPPELYQDAYGENSETGTDSTMVKIKIEKSAQISFAEDVDVHNFSDPEPDEIEIIWAGRKGSQEVTLSDTEAEDSNCRDGIPFATGTCTSTSPVVDQGDPMTDSQAVSPQPSSSSVLNPHCMTFTSSIDGIANRETNRESMAAPTHTFRPPPSEEINTKPLLPRLVSIKREKPDYTFTPRPNLFDEDPGNVSDSADSVFIVGEGRRDRVIDNVYLDGADPLSEPQPPSHLKEQYNSIISLLEIPHPEYFRAEAAVAKVVQCFSTSIPTFRASLFRHTFLRLRNPNEVNPNESCSKILIFCWRTDHNSSSRTELNLYALKCALRDSCNQKMKTLFPNFFLNDDHDFKQDEALQITCEHRRVKSISFTLVPHREYLVEARLCELLQYMCTFDSRAVPLITLFRYWSKVNKIKFGDSKTGYPGLLIPAPASLDWMIMSWMVASGYIPSPDLILTRDHLKMSARVERISFDVGFHKDRRLSKVWKHCMQTYPDEGGDGFILSVLELAQLFFQESSQLKAGNWLLHTRSSELRPLESLQWHRDVNQVFGAGRSGREKREALKAHSRTTRFGVISPFSGSCVLHVKNFASEEFDRMCDVMGESGKRLEKFIRALKGNKEPHFDLTDCFKIPKDAIHSTTRPKETSQSRIPTSVWTVKTRFPTEFRPMRVDSSADTKVSRRERLFFDIHREISEEVWKEDVVIFPTSAEFNSESFLQQQFSSIWSIMEIPDNEFNRIRTIIENVHKVIRENWESRDIFRLAIFRHNFLRLRDPGNMSSKEIMLYCWNGHLKSEKDRVVVSDRSTNVNELRKSIRTSEKLEELLPSTAFCDLNKDGFKNTAALGMIITVPDTSPISVTLVCHPAGLVEVQLCKLLQYMCTFHMNALPLLTLIRYWSKVNNIALGESNVGPPGIRIPAPASLDWLVISWMAAKGLLPSPRALLERPHKPLYVELDSRKIDVGFSADSECARKWMEKTSEAEYGTDLFFQNLVEMAQYFFEDNVPLFLIGNFLVNTRDAQIIRMSRFQQDNKVPSTCKLTSSEIRIVREKKFDPDNTTCFKTTQLHIVNPLTVMSSLHVNKFQDPEEFSKIGEAMEQTTKQLRGVLAALKLRRTDFDLAESLKVQQKKNK